MLLAYQYVAAALMLGEANFVADKLALPIERPIVASQLRVKSVAPPDIMRFGGRLDTDSFSFAFLNNGRLRFVTKLKPFGGLTLRERNDMLSRQKSLINTNEAYQLATQWLQAIEVDVAKLEAAHKPVISQQFFHDPEAPSGVRLLPIFDVVWGNRDDVKINVSIDGRTKTLLRLRQEDDSFSMRPAELIRDRDELLAIPDEEFLKYSQEQRKQLIARFAAVEYPPGPAANKHVPPASAPKPPLTPQK